MKSEPADKLGQDAWRLEQVSRALSGWLPRLAGNLSTTAGSIEENDTALAAFRQLIVDVGFETANQGPPPAPGLPSLGSPQRLADGDDAVVTGD